MPYSEHLSDDAPLADVRPRFSVRIETRFQTLGLKTVGDVRHTPDRKFLEGGNFGRKSLRELRQELGPYVPSDEVEVARTAAREAGETAAAKVKDYIRDHAAGNGRGEEPSPEELPAGTWAPLEPPLVTPKPVPSLKLTKIFVAAVENGYIIRPAYADSYKGAGDDRSWVVGSREELAQMVSWLVAERGKASPDMLGGPIHMPQPEAHYARPIGIGADETVG